MKGIFQHGIEYIVRVGPKSRATSMTDATATTLPRGVMPRVVEEEEVPVKDPTIQALPRCLAQIFIEIAWTKE